MFENNDDNRYSNQISEGRKRSGDPWSRLQTSPAIIDKVQSNTLDNEASEDVWHKLLGYYRKELLTQEENRYQQAKDCDFYDGIQMTAKEEATMRKRGQTPLVFNVIANTINWMLGTERRGRTDYKILPRREEGSQAAERKTEIMKYLADVNRAQFSVSRAFADTVKAGVGWLEEGIRDDDEGEPLYFRYESWRNMLHDSVGTELDLSDARYVFRSKWTDVDIAQGMFPSRKWVIERAANTTLDLFRALSETGDDPMDSQEQAYFDAGTALHGSDHDIDRKRVRLIEAWFRIPVESNYMSGGDFAGEIFDPSSDGHMSDVEQRRAKIVRKVKMRTHVAIFCEAGMLFLGKSPYRHNRFPFTPIWCYRRDRDNMPYGMVRMMRDPQTDVNKRAAKALHILNTSKTLMESGAVKDLKAFEEEAARPDAIIVYEAGKKIELNADRGMEQGHLNLMSQSMQLIQTMSGVTDENMGRTTNATSGKAIMARQDQGGLSTAPIFDNLRLARQVSGEKQLSNVEQFMSKQKMFRVTNSRGKPTYVTINDGLPENSITRTKADFIISEEAFAATIRQAQVDALLEFLSQVGQTSPEVVMATLDLLVETMDIPQREEIVKRIRQVTGAEDPDADPENPDPETQARKEAEAKQAEYQERMAMAELADKEASAEERAAKAQKARTEADKVVAEVRRILAETAGANVETQVQALQAAATLMAAPQIAGTADTMLADAGYDAGKTPPPPPGPPPGAQPQTMPPQQPAPPEQGMPMPAGGPPQPMPQPV